MLAQFGIETRYLKYALWTMAGLLLGWSILDWFIWGFIPPATVSSLMAQYEKLPVEIREYVTAYRTLVKVLVILTALTALGGYIGFGIYSKKARRANNEQLAGGAVLVSLTVTPEDKTPVQAAANMLLALRQVLAASSRDARLGKAPHMAFEMMVVGGESIRFYLWVNEQHKEMTVSLIQANYPDCSPMVEPDPMEKYQDGEVAWQELGLGRDSIYPIRTDFGKGDPLNTFLQALSLNAQTELAGIQFVCRPAAPEWQGKAEQVVANLRVQQAQVKANTIAKSQRESLSRLEAKKDMLGYEVCIRCFGAGNDQRRIGQLVQSFGQFAGDNQFTPIAKGNDWSILKQRGFPLHQRVPVLNVDEFAAVFHLPSVRTPHNDVAWRGAKDIPPPLSALAGEEEIKNRSCRVLGYYKQPDGQVTPVAWRYGYDTRTHSYCCGPTGSGKSTLLENWIVDDIECGQNSVVLMEPHDDLTRAVMDKIPPYRWGDVLIIDPTDQAFPFGFNPMEATGLNSTGRNILASSLMGTIKKADPNFASATRMQEVLESTLLAMLEVEPEATLYTTYRFLSNEAYRNSIIPKLRDPMTVSYWQENFAALPDKTKQDMMDAPLRRLRTWLRNEIIRNLVVQPRSTIRFRQFMDNRKVMLIKLSTGTLGEINASLLGALMIGMFWGAASSRRDIPEPLRVECDVYMDEFQNYVSDDISTVLSEARKFGLAFNMANQFLAQVAQESPRVYEAIKGNCGTKYIYSLTSPGDISIMTKMLGEPITERDLKTLPPFHGYAQLMSNKRRTNPFLCAAPPPRQVKDWGDTPPAVNDANFVPMPANIPPGVVKFLRQLGSLPDETKMSTLATMSEPEWQVYQQARQALYWKQRNKLLANTVPGSVTNLEELFKKLTRMSIGTPVWEVAALMERIKHKETALAGAMGAVEEGDGEGSWAW